jgi:hypothetical protein
MAFEFNGFLLRQVGTLLCPKTCPCHQSFREVSQRSSAVSHVLAAACAYASCTRYHVCKASGDVDGDADCPEGCWSKLVKSSAALLEALPNGKAILAAVLSATYVMGTSTLVSSQSLAWLTLTCSEAMDAATSTSRLEWLLAHGACVEQGCVNWLCAMTCRLACVAVARASTRRVVERVGFHPCRMFFCAASAYHGISGAYVKKWARWHRRPGRQRWCGCVVMLHM